MHQLSFFPETKIHKNLVRSRFSHASICPEAARVALDERYADFFEETDKFNRQLVSFQANKTEVLHSWLKYREGFSAGLIEALFDELANEPDDAILDPFAGSATTLLVAKMLGIDFGEYFSLNRLLPDVGDGIPKIYLSGWPDYNGR